MGPWRSPVAHLHGMQGVRGSNPLGSTTLRTPPGSGRRSLRSDIRGLPQCHSLRTMDHTALKQFVAAARYLHFAHASRALGIPRSELIATIRSIEAHLGYELFDSSASSTQLTNEGQAFLVDAERQLASSARAAEASAAKPGGKAKASKGKGRAPAVKGQPKPGRKRQSR